MSSQARGPSLALPSRALIASFVILWAETSILTAEQKGFEFEALFFALLPAFFLSVPQLIGLIAAGSRYPILKGVGWVCALITFALAIWITHDVFTSKSSTAGVALVFWPTIASLVVCGILLLACIAQWIEPKWRKRRS